MTKSVRSVGVKEALGGETRKASAVRISSRVGEARIRRGPCGSSGADDPAQNLQIAPTVRVWFFTPAGV